VAIIDKLNYLNETKELIKDSLNDLGAEITDEDTFRSYVTKIDELSEEYPTEAQIQSIQLQNIQPQSIEKTLNIEMQPLEQPQEESLEKIQKESLEESPIELQETQEESLEEAIEETQQATQETEEETTLNDEEVE